MKQKLKKRNRFWTGTVIVILTAFYLLATGAAAQVSPKTADNTTKITYTKDPLSYGDIYAFNEGAYNDSAYSFNNQATATNVQNNSSSTTSSSKASCSLYARYGTFTGQRHSNTISGAPIANHALSHFYSNITMGTVDSPLGNGITIPVAKTTGTGVYTIVPGTTGTYRVYFYAPGGASDANQVKYTLISDYTSANNYSGTSTTAFGSVTAVGSTGWYYGEVSVSGLGWTACAITVNSDASGGSDQTKEQTFTGATLNKTSLNSKTYYYNTWSSTEVKYDTILVLQFPSTVSLGPITKTGDTVTIHNASGGTVTVQNIFGESIATDQAVSVPHMPIFFTATPSDIQYSFTGMEGIGVTEAGGLYRYDYESTFTATAKWEKAVAFPTVVVTGGTIASSGQKLDFYRAPEGSTSFVTGQAQEYTISVDFTNAEAGVSVAYTVSTGASGTLTETGVISFSAAFDPVTVTLTAKNSAGDVTKVITYTVTPDDTSLPTVAKIGATEYKFLEDALAAMNTGAETTNLVYLTTNYTMHVPGQGKAAWDHQTASGYPDGYTVPSGKTLIIQHSPDANYTSSGNHPYTYETQVGTVGGTGAKPDDGFTYAELTLPGGTSIYVKGVMTVGGTTNGVCLPINANGSTKYYHANVRLMANAGIRVESGGILSSVGFIYGDGTVTAASGAKVYMPFSILDFRGGGYTVGVAGKMDSSYGMYSDSSKAPSGESFISPFLRYTMNAIQCTLKLEPGAALHGYMDLYTTSTGDHNNTNAFIISTDSNALIVTTGATGVEITYDSTIYASTYPHVGKSCLKIMGNASFGNLKMTVSAAGGIVTATINTNQLNFPVPYNYDIELVSGTFSIPYSIMLLPGSRITVDEGATMNVSSSLTIYDGLHDYTMGGTESATQIVLGAYKDFNPTSSSFTTVNPGSNYPTTAVLRGTSFGGSGSADFIVNGTLNLNSGSKVGGIIQTASNSAARITTASDAVCSTTTQIGAVGQYTINLYIKKATYAFVGATVRTLQGQVLDAATGQRTKLYQGMTYLPSAGMDNITSYDYTLYYACNGGSYSGFSTNLTEEVACTLQGSWYNYEVPVNMSYDGEVMTIYMKFAHGTDVSGDDYYYDESHTQPVTTITSDAPLYCGTAIDMEAKIQWADGSATTYYPTLRNAIKDAVHVGDRVVLLKDLEDFSSGVSPTKDQDFIFDLAGHTISYSATPFTSINGGKLTVDLNGGTVTSVGTDAEGNTTYTDALLAQVNEGSSMVIDLNGGTMTYATGQTAADTAHRGAAAIVNGGELTIQDTAGGGKVTMDAVSDNGDITNLVAAVRNNATGVLTLDGATLECTQTVNNASVGVLNFTGTITTVKNCTINCTNGYALYNYSGTIQSIEGGQITGRWGIYNRNYRTVAVANGVTPKIYAVATIDTIKDANVTCTSQYALWNGGVINTIGGSAQFHNTGTSSYIVYNSNLWYWDNYYATLKDNTAGSYTRTYTYAGEDCIPTIGTIQDSVEISSTTCSYGVTNLGNIGTITGSVKISAKSYGLYISEGGRVDTINGSVTIEANTSERALQISSQRVSKLVTTYQDKIGGPTLKTETTYGRPSSIGTISGNVTIYAKTNYALSNTGVIDSITGSGVKIEAGGSYGLQNAEGGRMLTRVETHTNLGTVDEVNAGHYLTLWEFAYTYQEDGAYIGLIDGVGIIANTDSALQNQCTIGQLQNVQIRATRNTAIHNTNGHYLARKTFSLKHGTAAYATTQYIGESTVSYQRGQPVIGSMTNVTAAASTGYGCLVNLGRIETIDRCSFTAKNYNALQNGNVATGYYLGDHASEYDQYKAFILKEPSYVFRNLDSTNTYTRGYIGSITNTSITCTNTSSTYVAAFDNAGYIGTIGAGTTITVEAVSSSYRERYYGLRNTGDSYAARRTVYKNITDAIGGLGTPASGTYYRQDEFTNTYSEDGCAEIGTITGLTITNPFGFGIINYAEIGTIGSGTRISAYQNAVYNYPDGRYTGTKQSVRLNSGTAAYGTTSVFNESSIAYTRTPAHIALIDGATIETITGANGINNAGHIGEIRNSAVSAFTQYAIYNSSRTNLTYQVDYAGNGVEGLNPYIVWDATNSKYVFAISYAESKSYTATCQPAVIDLIGQGNTLTAKQTGVIYNAAEITEINSGAAYSGGSRTELGSFTPTTITPEAGYGIYNYQGTAVTETVVAGKASYTYDPAQIGSIANVKIDAVTYAIQNGDGSSSYALTIGSLGKGVEAKSTSNNAIYNRTYASLGSITDGIYTATASGKYAVYNENTSAPISISGGDFKGGTAGRAYAIYQPDATTRQVYTGSDATKFYTLLSTTESVTFHDGTTATGYYPVGVYRITLTLNGHGGKNGTATTSTRTIDRPPSDSTNLTIANPFKRSGWTFYGWQKEGNTNFLLGDSGWTGTWSALASHIGTVNPGGTYTLDAIWATTVTYKAGTGSGTDHQESIVEGSGTVATAISYSDAGFAPPAGYSFTGWQDSGGKYYAAGDPLGTANKLTAVWSRYSVTITWDPLVYTYVKSYRWDAANMKYVETSNWWTDNSGSRTGNTVTVANNSQDVTAVVSANLNFQKNNKFDLMYKATADGALANIPASGYGFGGKINQGQTGKVWLMLSGDPGDSPFSDLNAGSVTLTVKKALPG